MKVRTVMISVVAFAGCTATGPVAGSGSGAVFQHPVTGDVLHCNDNTREGWTAFGVIGGVVQGTRYANCNSELEARGYQRVRDSFPTATKQGAEATPAEAGVCPPGFEISAGGAWCFGQKSDQIPAKQAPPAQPAIAPAKQAPPAQPAVAAVTNLEAWVPGHWKSAGGTNALTISQDFSWQWRSTFGGDWKGNGGGRLEGNRIVLTGSFNGFSSAGQRVVNQPITITLTREGDALAGDLFTSRTWRMVFERQ